MPSPRMRRQARSVRWLALALLLAAGPAMAHADARLQRQRERFAQAYAQAQAGDPAWRSAAAELRGYPLYPYLESAWLRHDAAAADAARVRAYLARYGDLIPGRALRRAWLDRLAAHSDWRQYLEFYTPGLGSAYDCRALQAETALGRTLHFAGRFAALWRRVPLPAACTDLLDAAAGRGLLTPARVWTRIDQAVRQGAAASLAQAAAWLPAGQRPAVRRLLLALQDPAAALLRALQWPDDARARQALVLALLRRAPQDDSAAAEAWQMLRARYRLDARQRDAVAAALALYAAVDFEPSSRRGLMALPAAAQTAVTRAWQVRVALAEGDWPGVLAAIRAMPPPQRGQNEWRYFEARALAATGQDAAADARWRALARSPTYYGFLAADRVRRPYALCPRDPADSTAARAAAESDPGLQRAFEWFALGRLAHARREWDAALPKLDPAVRYAAAVLAHRRGWVDRAVFLLGHGEALRDYRLRFPLAQHTAVFADARAAGIDPVWVYATIRTESAWMSDARSDADAIGLMQLVPRTAARVARASALPWQGADSLTDAAVNIGLGVRHLKQLADRFGPQWLASAAYNAGSQPVRRWLTARGSLPPDVFVATIPYAETRGYVESTLAFSVIYDWRLHADPVRLSARLAPAQDRYAPPGAVTPRATVACSAADLLAQGGTPAPAVARSAAPAVAASVAAGSIAGAQR